MAELLFHRYGKPILRLPIDRDIFKIGKGPGNHLVIPDDELANDEAVFELREGGWWIVNASENGSRLDAAIVKDESPVTDGAVLHLGKDWKAAFQLGVPTSPGETRLHTVHASKKEEKEKRHFEITWTPYDSDKAVSCVLGENRILTIGQDEENDIPLSDQYVSSFHARIFKHEENWCIADLQSTNGTFLDEIRIGKAVLEPGMIIRVGKTKLRVGEKSGPSLAVPADQYGLITADPLLLEIIHQLPRVGSTDATVTIFGESGTGKELMAKAVHDAGKRSKKPFIPVNCAAISKDLMESELFGHEKGAFTGAVASRRGAFEEANGGTLFLDEVGELPLDLQAKLLRAIELKEIRRVGSSKSGKVDVRIVAATNRDLHTDVRDGKFREDLFYRLYVIPLTLPPLRRRQKDIILLAEYFIRKGSPEDPPVLSDEARAKLLEHNWPGNVRELKNTMERALLFRRGLRISDQDIIFPPSTEEEKLDDKQDKKKEPEKENIAVQQDDDNDQNNEADTSYLINIKNMTLARIEREALEITLKKTGGSRKLTAQKLGIARSTLQYKIKELNVSLDNSGQDIDDKNSKKTDK